MIHKYTLNSFNIVIDVNSGGIHVVDNITYELLDHVAPPLADVLPENIAAKLSVCYSQEELEEAYAEILELAQEGVLFSEDDYEKFADMMVSAPIKSLCLHVAHDCNLRCKYCLLLPVILAMEESCWTKQPEKKQLIFYWNILKGAVIWNWTSLAENR